MIHNFKEFLNEAKKPEPDLKALETLLEGFRSKMETDDEWSEYKECFKGTCQDNTNRLEKFLKDAGYDAVRTRGYYTNAGDDYYPDMEDWDLDDTEWFQKKHDKNDGSSNGLKFPHWWIEVFNSKYIIDLTEDQFHPGEEDDYRIGVYKKPVKYYKKG